MKNYDEVLKNRLDNENYRKLSAIENTLLHKFVAEYVQLCDPESVSVITDSQEDIDYIRELSIRNGEEQKLAMEGHTIHFDGYNDQARDKDKTRYLLEEGVDLGERLNSIEKTKGLEEMHSLLSGIMQGKQMLVRFFCLGPINSPFSIPAMQLTDSAYVGHSEDILYRPGYEQFRSMGDSDDFFRVVHSAGELEGGVSKNVDKRRIYIDPVESIVYSANTQYAGNTVGLKKLSLRMAIRKADKEGWLAEHMLLMGVNGPGGRRSYFCGAFPSACGKTSTAMIPGETIVGDDIAYLRPIDGDLRAVNVEAGIFGIIRDVNPEDDPIIWDALNKPGEVIFSNVLLKDEKPYWLGMGREIPESGYNHSGEWFKGKKDDKGAEITPSHKNARYTVSLAELENCDENLNDPAGVPVCGVIYGGRDSDTSVPVEQGFDWTHGIITKGASLESETTAATLGQEGVRVFQPMSNIDFVSLPLGRYVQNNLDIVEKLDGEPQVFGTNYFLKDENGGYLNGMHDKRVWLKWMELRVHGDVGAVERPTGLIPEYEDLKSLFKDVLGKEYTKEDYERQFAMRVEENLAKIDRIEKIYRESVSDTPQVLFDVLQQQRKRLEDAS